MKCLTNSRYSTGGIEVEGIFGGWVSKIYLFSLILLSRMLSSLFGWITISKKKVLTWLRGGSRLRAAEAAEAASSTAARMAAGWTGISLGLQNSKSLLHRSLSLAVAISFENEWVSEWVSVLCVWHRSTTLEHDNKRACGASGAYISEALSPRVSPAGNARTLC